MDKFLDELEKESEQQSQNQNVSFNSLVENVAELSTCGMFEDKDLLRTYA